MPQLISKPNHLTRENAHTIRKNYVVTASPAATDRACQVIMAIRPSWYLQKNGMVFPGLSFDSLWLQDSPCNHYFGPFKLWWSLWKSQVLTIIGPVD
jgi:hypothetical protein